MEGIKIPISIENQNFTEAAREAKNAIKNVKHEAKGLESELSGMLKQAAAYAGLTSAMATVAGIFRNNIETAKNFEKSMSELRSLTGLFGEDLEYLSEQAKKLGSTTTQSATQVIDAMKLIGSQKPELLKNKNALAEITAQAITLAEASGMDVPDAASALTTALNQMGASASYASEYINIMAAASQQGAGDIRYINQAVVQAGATAKMANVQFNELTAAIEAVAKGGYDASTAGTSLRNIFVNLEKQTNSKFKPSAVGLTAALENLANANLSTAQKAELFGVQNIAVADTLITEREECAKLKKTITGTNTAYEQAAINTDNFAGSVKNLESAWEGLMLKINESNGFLKVFVDSITDVLNGDLSGDMRRVSKLFDSEFKQTLDNVAKLYPDDAEQLTREELEKNAKRIYEEMFRHADNEHQKQIAKDTYAMAVKYVDELVDKKKSQVKETPPDPKPGGGDSDGITEEEKARRKKLAQQARKLKDLRLKLADEEKEHMRTLELETAQAEIEAMAEGNERVLAEIEHQFVEEMSEIDKWYEDLKKKKAEDARALWEAENPEGIWKEENLDPHALDLSQAEIDAYAAKTVAAENKRSQALQRIWQEEENAMNDFLIKFGDYEQQREAINRKYQKQVEDAKNEGTKLVAKAEWDTALADLDEKFGKSTSKIIKLWKDVSGASRKELKSMIDTLEELQKAVSDGNITPDEQSMLEKLGFTDQDIALIKRGETNVEKIVARIKALKGEVSNTSNVIENLGDSLEAVFGKNGKMNRENIDAMIQSFGSAASNIMPLVEGIGDIAAAFGNESMKKDIEDVGNILNSTLSMASAGNQIGGAYGALAGAILGLGSGIAQAIGAHADDDQIRAIEKAQKKINALKRCYEELGDAVDATYSQDKADNINKEIDNLNRQNALIQTQIRNEKGKKNSDDSAIEAYENSIYENQRKIKELKKQAEDAIFGSDIQTAISNFADAYSDAMSNNTSRTRSAKEQIRKMMQDMVRESIKAATEASGAMDRIREKLADYFRDGILSDAEQHAIYAEAEKLQYDLDKKFSWADKLMDNDNSMLQGSAGGFKTMSQESADELNGRFTAGQITMDGILQQTMMIYASNQQVVSIETESNETMKEIRNLIIGVASNVEDIATYTKVLGTFGAKFDEMNRKLDRL